METKYWYIIGAVVIGGIAYYEYDKRKKLKLKNKPQSDEVADEEQPIGGGGFGGGGDGGFSAPIEEKKTEANVGGGVRGGVNSPNVSFPRGGASSPNVSSPRGGTSSPNVSSPRGGGHPNIHVNNPRGGRNIQSRFTGRNDYFELNDSIKDL